MGIGLSYEQLEDGTYNLIIRLTGAAPNAAAITQINGEDLAGKEFYEYVRTEGAVLFSFNPNFSPAALYGGSWEKVMDRFPIGAGGSYALGSTGGNATHTNTVDEMATHAHTERVNPYGNPRTIALVGSNAGGAVVEGAYFGQQAIGGTSTDTAVITESIGNGSPYSILPPYIACNIWRKVA